MVAKFALLLSVVVFLVTGAVASASAQSTAQSTAAALQSWRDACGDPNPDKAIGFLNQAIETGNIDVRKVCLRELFASDNRDVKSAALRVAIAALPVVRFRVSPPETKERFYSKIMTGMVFHAVNGDAATGTATWLTTIQNTQPQEDVGGEVIVLGPGVIWSGIVKSGNGVWKCDLAADLAEGPELEGILNCGSLGVYNVSTNLLN